ncbi:MAG TPA: ester cyclase [Ktedonosporobacter sp.]|nr:ester cyclase [Ktedonosporobacter sp.]
MSTEENKALVRRWFTALNAAESQAIDDLFFPNFTYHLPGGQSQLEGSGPFKGFIVGFHSAFPDLYYTIEDLVAEGDRVMARWVARGTNTGSSMGLPATNKPVTITGVNIYHVAGSRFVEQWTEFDHLGMLQQMGVLPPLG